MKFGELEYVKFCDVFGSTYVKKYYNGDEIKNFDEFLINSTFFNYYITEKFLLSGIYINVSYFELSMKETYEMFGIDVMHEVRERGYIEIDASYFVEIQNKRRVKKLERIMK